MRRSLIVETSANSCYFRTSVAGDARKALIQITERCNLHCAHCFVSSGRQGIDMAFSDIVEKVFPRLRQARVERLTLTGGEPFAHPAIMEICMFAADQGVPLGICTNATQTSDEQIAELAGYGNVHINVSLDGFRPQSHGKFRGDIASFDTTVATVRKFAEAGLLQGLLSTPNALTSVVPALAGRFFTTEPPGKPLDTCVPPFIWPLVGWGLTLPSLCGLQGPA